MNLETGVYKIKGRGVMSKCHYLLVFYQDSAKYYQLDAEVAQPCEENGRIPLDGLKVLKKLGRPLLVKKVKLTLEWEDDDGDAYEMPMRDLQLLRRLFTEYPEIARAFGSKRWQALSNKSSFKARFE